MSVLALERLRMNLTRSVSPLRRERRGGIVLELRLYRNRMIGEDLVPFVVWVGESDLWVAVDQGGYSPDLEAYARSVLEEIRAEVEDWITRHPEFSRSLTPVGVPSGAPPVVKAMADAAALTGVGPMAAVAGAIAEEMGKRLRAQGAREVIVENGGDIYMVSRRSRRVALYAGEWSPWTFKAGLLIEADDTPCGIATSAGSFGHSLSFGRADAVSVVAGSAALADALATAVGNCVSSPEDIPLALGVIKRHLAGGNDVRGGVIVMGDKMGACGDIRLVPVNDSA